MKRIGILYHPKRTQAVAYADELERFLGGPGRAVWKCSSSEESAAKTHLPGTEMVISVGGDGTILRTARIVAPQPIPILGVNLGKVGFLTELTAADALAKLPDLLSGRGWVEKRAFLEARVSGRSGAFTALNDIVIARGASVRLIQVEVRLDGEYLATYRADGVVAATATGSTGYNLAAGGPILHPESRDMVLKPISPHFSPDQALVLPSDTTVRLKVTTSHEAVVSVDGQVEFPLQDGDEVTARPSPSFALLLRSRPKTYFYNSLEQILRGKVL